MWTSDVRLVVMALLGGLLGWALGKLLDRLLPDGYGPYVVVVILVLLLLVFLS